MSEFEEENTDKRPFDQVIEDIVNRKVKNGEVKPDELDGFTLNAEDLKPYEDEFNGAEPFKTADTVKVEDVEEYEKVFLHSNAAFVGDEVIISSVELTTVVSNLNEMAETSAFYAPKMTPIMTSSSLEPVRYVIMKLDGSDKLDKEKAKKNFNNALENPEKYCDSSRYLVIKGRFNMVNAPYGRDVPYAVRINDKK